MNELSQEEVNKLEKIFNLAKIFEEIMNFALSYKSRLLICVSCILDSTSSSSAVVRFGDYSKFFHIQRPR